MLSWKRLAAAGLAALATAGLTGCATDRNAEADHIRAAVKTMPGVASSDVFYINDFENGANLDIGLDMTHATIDQIRATVDGINDLEGSGFDDHRLTTKMVVADTTEVEYGGDGKHLNADQISADVTAVRRMRPDVTSANIQWKHFNDYSSLELSDSADPDQDLRVGIAALPNSSTRLYVGSVAPLRKSSWDVTPPLTVEQMDDAVGIRDRLPVVFYEVGMREGHVVDLSVNLGDPSKAASHAVAVVSAVTPSPAHPLTVEWRLTGAGNSEVDRFTACSPVSSPVAVAPTNPSFASLKDWAAKVFASCNP